MDDHAHHSFQQFEGAHVMAVLSAFSEAGEQSLYDIPDPELSKYKMNTAPMTDEVRSRLFPDKDKLTKDDAHGVIVAAPSGDGDVQAYGGTCLYWFDDGT
jgi:hypothetical protein